MLFFPIGLVLVWLSRWNMPTRIIVTSGVAVLLVLSVATSGSPSKATESAQEATSSTEAVTQPPTTTTTTEPSTTTASPTTTPPATAPPTTTAFAPAAATGIQIGPGPQAIYTVQPQPAPGSCHYTSIGSHPLPDPHCTPGAISPQVTQADNNSTIRSREYTDAIRPPEDITEQEQYASAAGYGYTGPLDVAEYDHLVPLELGGDPNDPANLWVEPPDNPNATSTANTKDLLENKLNDLVCSGRLSLAAARQAIASDPVTAYRTYGGESY